jgi:hypothetical protein
MRGCLCVTVCLYTSACYVCAGLCSYMCAGLCVCRHVSMCMCLSLRVCGVHVCLCLSVHVCTHVCPSLCLCVLLCAPICVLFVSECTYVYNVIHSQGGQPQSQQLCPLGLVLTITPPLFSQLCLLTTPPGSERTAQR